MRAVKNLKKKSYRDSTDVVGLTIKNNMQHSLETKIYDFLKTFWVHSRSGKTRYRPS